MLSATLRRQDYNDVTFYVFFTYFKKMFKKKLYFIIYLIQTLFALYLANYILNGLISKAIIGTIQTLTQQLLLKKTNSVDSCCLSVSLVHLNEKNLVPRIFFFYKNHLSMMHNLSMNLKYKIYINTYNKS